MPNFKYRKPISKFIAEEKDGPYRRKRRITQPSAGKQREKASPHQARNGTAGAGRIEFPERKESSEDSAGNAIFDSIGNLTLRFQ